MKKVIRLTESQLNTIIKKIIKEGTQEAMMAEINSDFSSLGLPTVTIEELSSNEIPTKIITASASNDSNPEDIAQKESTFREISNKICVANEEQLRLAKQEIKEILKQKMGRLKQSIRNVFRGKKQETNEQAGLLAGTASVLGVTAPIWVWIAIGAVVLFLICKFILFPKRDGYGCRGRESWGGLIRRINSP